MIDCDLPSLRKAARETTQASVQGEGCIAPTPTIEALIAAWVEAFNARDLNAHVALYTHDATLFGSRPVLSIGREAIRAYFAALGPEVRAERFHEPQVIHPTPQTAAIAAFVDFVDGVVPSPYRMTWMAVQRDGEWRIAQHHGSPRLDG